MSTKVALTHLKIFKKSNKTDVINGFIDTLVKSGMPEEKSKELMKSGSVSWELESIDSRSIFAAEIISDKAKG